MQQVDGRLNEWQGNLDQINNGAITDGRTAVHALSSLNASVTLDINGKASLLVHLNVTVQFNAATTVVVQGTVDGTNYFTVPFFVIQSGGATLAAENMTNVVPGSTTVGHYLICAPTTGFRQMRVLMNAFTTAGTVSVAARATDADYRIITQPQPSPLGAALLMAAVGPTSFIPAPAAGLFQYITSLHIALAVTGTLVTAAASPTLTLSNLPSFVINVPATGAVGTQQIIFAADFSNPMKASAAGTVINATLSALPVNATYRLRAAYYLGA